MPMLTALTQVLLALSALTLSAAAPRKRPTTETPRSTPEVSQYLAGYISDELNLGREWTWQEAARAKEGKLVFSSPADSALYSKVCELYVQEQALSQHRKYRQDYPIIPRYSLKMFKERVRLARRIRRTEDILKTPPEDVILMSGTRMFLPLQVGENTEAWHKQAGGLRLRAKCGLLKLQLVAELEHSTGTMGVDYNRSPFTDNQEIIPSRRVTFHKYQEVREYENYLEEMNAEMEMIEQAQRIEDPGYDSGSELDPGPDSDSGPDSDTEEFQTRHRLKVGKFLPHPKYADVEDVEEPQSRLKTPDVEDSRSRSQSESEVSEFDSQLDYPGSRSRSQSESEDSETEDSPPENPGSRSRSESESEDSESDFLLDSPDSRSRSQSESEDSEFDETPDSRSRSQSESKDSETEESPPENPDWKEWREWKANDDRMRRQRAAYSDPGDSDAENSDTQFARYAKSRSSADNKPAAKEAQDLTSSGPVKNSIA